jgi:hypothetical protein
MRPQIPTHDSYITAHARRWRSDRNLISLLSTAYHILRQGRGTEVLYGLYCMATSRASLVQAGETEGIQAVLPAMESELMRSIAVLSRDELVELFRDWYAVAELPDDFEGCRTQALARIGSRLVIGEYGRCSSRVVVVSRERCEVFRPYEQMSGVRHIHLICPTGNRNEFFVTTGDATKVLDRFVLADGAPRFVERHRAKFAGYTAAANVRGQFFFGTDFSSRPNYLETLQGRKHFFPEPAYSKWVVSLTSISQRYLAVVSCDVRRGDSRTVSVFDAVEQAFVLCKSWAELFQQHREPEYATASWNELSSVHFERV